MSGASDPFGLGLGLGLGSGWASCSEAVLDSSGVVSAMAAGGSGVRDGVDVSDGVNVRDSVGVGAGDSLLESGAVWILPFTSCGMEMCTL